jgi:hypothetical protein
LAKRLPSTPAAMAPIGPARLRQKLPLEMLAENAGPVHCAESGEATRGAAADG